MIFVYFGSLIGFMLIASGLGFAIMSCPERSTGTVAESQGTGFAGARVEGPSRSHAVYPAQSLSTLQQRIRHSIAVQGGRGDRISDLPSTFGANASYRPVDFLPGSLSGNLLHSSKLHVVERFTLNPTTLELTGSIVAEDPEYFADKDVDTDSVVPADAPFEVEPCKELAPEYQQTGRK